MAKFFTQHELYKLRNSIPLADVLSTPEWPHKIARRTCLFRLPSVQRIPYGHQPAYQPGTLLSV